jgi:hypothetical protein
VKIADRLIITAIILAVSIIAAVAFAAEGSGKMKVQIPPDPQLYSITPQPLTAVQCAQCHPSVFQTIKDNGGKHRFDCQKCHTTFHVYNPKKGNYDTIMPKCDTCHNQPHGEKVTDCSSCHANPHTPRKVTMSAALANACSQCHPGPQEQLTTFTSKHSKVSCDTCHTAHGLKPSCFNCHKPHMEGQKAAACTTCHPVHKPLQVTYPNDTPSALCGVCHTKVYSTWKKTVSKHAMVNCALCHHTKHKYKPQCTECHSAPHPAGILARYPKCLSCHLDVHDLPVGRRKK